MTLYGFELLFSEDTPKEVQESIRKIIEETPPDPGLFDMEIEIHEAKLRYIPAIELTAIHGPYRSGDVKRAFEYLSGKVEVKRGKSQFEGSRRHHCFWPANVFELDEVKAEIEFMKSGSFLRLESEDDVKLVKKSDLWHNCESTLKLLPEYRQKYKLDEMSEEERNKAIWEVVIEFVRPSATAYEKILDTYKKFNTLFWFTFYRPIF